MRFGHIRVRRFSGEQLLFSRAVDHKQTGGDSIILCGTLSWVALRLLVVVEQTMKAPDCTVKKIPIKLRLMPGSNVAWKFP